MSYLDNLCIKYVDILRENGINSKFVIDFAISLKEIDFCAFVGMLELLENYCDLIEFVNKFSIDFEDIDEDSEEIFDFEEEQDNDYIVPKEDDIESYDFDYTEVSEEPVEFDEIDYSNTEEDSDEIYVDFDNLDEESLNPDESLDEEFYLEESEEDSEEISEDSEEEEFIDFDELGDTEEYSDGLQESEEENEDYVDFESLDSEQEVIDTTDLDTFSNFGDFEFNDVIELGTENKGKQPKMPPKKTKIIPNEKLVDTSLDIKDPGGLVMKKKEVKPVVNIFEDPLTNRIYNLFRKT